MNGNSAEQRDSAESPSRKTPQRVSVGDLLRDSGLKYRVDDEERERYQVWFVSDNHPQLIVAIWQQGNYVCIFAVVLRIPETAPLEFYRHLLELNERIWQGKFAILNDMLLFEIEIPSHILTAEELRDEVMLVAGTVDDHYPELFRMAFG